MDIYQHDNATVFRFVLRGALRGERVRELEDAWNASQSILDGKELVVEVSGVTDADRWGVSLLSRMREAGARLTAARPPEFEELLELLDEPIAAPRERGGRARVWRMLGSARR